MTDSAHEPVGHDETPEQRRARMEQVTSFAGYLTSIMVEAVQETGMHWDDAVFAATLAIRAIGEITVKMTATSPQPWTRELVERRIDKLLAASRSAKLYAVPMDSQEELDAYIANKEKGFH